LCFADVPPLMKKILEGKLDVVSRDSCFSYVIHTNTNLILHCRGVMSKHFFLCEKRALMQKVEKNHFQKVEGFLAFYLLVLTF
jgi:hypothetical protein